MRVSDPSPEASASNEVNGWWREEAAEKSAVSTPEPPLTTSSPSPAERRSFRYRHQDRHHHRHQQVGLCPVHLEVLLSVLPVSVIMELTSDVFDIDEGVRPSPEAVPATRSTVMAEEAAGEVMGINTRTTVDVIAIISREEIITKLPPSRSSSTIATNKLVFAVSTLKCVAFGVASDQVISGTTRYVFDIDEGVRPSPEAVPATRSTVMAEDAAEKSAVSTPEPLLTTSSPSPAERRSFPLPPSRHRHHHRHPLIRLICRCLLNVISTASNSIFTEIRGHHLILCRLMHDL